MDQSHKLGKHKLNVEVDVQTVPLEYLYLEQYHGFNHPLTGTKYEKSFFIDYF